MKISVITVCLNSERTIEKTICSVLKQSYDDIEYIIIDGGSSDETLKIIGKYESGISKWVSEPDYGIYDAMNKGIQLTTGDVIGIINSDDWYEDEALSVVASYYEAHPEAECTYGKYVCVSIHDETVFSKVEDCPLMDYPHPTVFVRRAVYGRVGLYDTSYKICADSDFMFRCQSVGIKFHYIPEIIAYFRLGGFSRTARTNAMPLEFKRSWMSLKEKGLLSCSQQEYVGKKIDDVRHRYLLDYLLKRRLPRYGQTGRAFKGLLKQSKKKKFMLWGAGRDAVFVYHWFCGHEHLLAGFIDKDETKQLYRIGRFPVLSPNGVPYTEYLIIISTNKYQNEIKVLMEKEGFQEGKDFYSIKGLLRKIVKWTYQER